MYRPCLIIRFDRTISSERRITPITTFDRSAAIDRAVAGFDTMMQRLAGSHAPDFVEIDVTMPQAKVMYLLAAAGDLRMSDLVAQLGVSLSTVSGLVDRVVDHGLAIRREDAVDRRHVVVSLTPAGRTFVDRFRELNARQVRDLLELLDDDGLRIVGGALAVLSDAAGRLVAASAPDVKATSPSPTAPPPLPASAFPADRKEPA